MPAPLSDQEAPCERMRTAPDKVGNACRGLCWLVTAPLLRSRAVCHRSRGPPSDDADRLIKHNCGCRGQVGSLWTPWEELTDGVDGREDRVSNRMRPIGRPVARRKEFSVDRRTLVGTHLLPARGAHCAPRRVTAIQREERRKHREPASVTLYGWPIHMRPTAPGSPSQDLRADPVAT